MNENIQLQAAVRLAKQGDAQAFEDLYGLTCKYAYFHAKSILKDDDEAWDLVQETYIAVYQNIGTLKEDKYIKSWIGGIVFNLGHKKLRKNVDLLVSEDNEFLFENIEENDRDLSPEEALDSKETISIVRDVIDSLPALQKAAVIAYYFDEKSIATIADEAMCSVGTIKSRLNYARKAMKDCILQREKRMGVSLHSVSGPIIIFVLHKMFVQTQISAQKARKVLMAIEKGVETVNVVNPKSASKGGAQYYKPVEPSKVTAFLFGTAKMKAISAAALMVVTVGTAIGVTAAAGGGNHHEVSVTMAATTQESTELTQLETTAAESTEPRPVSGWVEVDNGWKYMEEDKTYVSHTWKEVDGVLYYFKKDETMATGDVYLGRQIFTFNDSGIMEKIAEIDDGTYYDEDIKYSGGDGLFVSKADGSTEKIFDAQGVQKVVVEDDIAYLMSEQFLYKINTDGSNLKTFTSSMWHKAIDITLKDGDAYFCYTDETYADADLPHGGLQSIVSDSFTDDHYFRTGIGGEPAYKQLQVADDWIYYLHSNTNPLVYEGAFHEDALFRISLNGEVVERITMDRIGAYFVYGNTLYYMRGKTLKKSSISEAIEEEKKEREWVKHNPVSAYEKYVTDTLEPVYGRFRSTDFQYYYKLGEFPEPGRPSLDEGILTTYIDDMDMDGQPELMAFFAYQYTDSYADEDMDFDIWAEIYTIIDGVVQPTGSGNLINGIFDSDTLDFKIFIKSTGGKKILGISAERLVFSYGDGTTYTLNLLQSVDNRLKPILDINEAGSDFQEEDIIKWANEVRGCGFDTSADELLDTYHLYISDKEPDCKVLVSGHSGMELFTGDYDEPHRFLAEMYEIGDMTLHPIVGKITIH